MYDDEDEESTLDEQVAKKERVIEDPIVLMRQGFGAGQQAFRLFYGDDSDDKDEVRICYIHSIVIIVAPR